jgi:hypothetical protein
MGLAHLTLTDVVAHFLQKNGANLESRTDSRIRAVGSRASELRAGGFIPPERIGGLTYLQFPEIRRPIARQALRVF